MEILLCVGLICSAVSVAISLYKIYDILLDIRNGRY